MRLFWNIVHLLLFCYVLVLLLRISISIVRNVDPAWRPRRFMLVVAEVTYSLTDPPLNLLKRLVPPVQIGGMRIDVAFIALFVIVNIVRFIAALYR